MAPFGSLRGVTGRIFSIKLKFYRSTINKRINCLPPHHLVNLLWTRRYPVSDVQLYILYWLDVQIGHTSTRNVFKRKFSPIGRTLIEQKFPAPTTYTRPPREFNQIQYVDFRHQLIIFYLESSNILQTFVPPDFKQKFIRYKTWISYTTWYIFTTNLQIFLKKHFPLLILIKVQAYQLHQATEGSKCTQKVLALSLSLAALSTM